MAAFDWPQIRRFLIGRCGRSERDCFYVTMTELEALQDGKRREDQEWFERKRWQLYMEVRMLGHPKRMPQSPRDICSFKWEKDEDAVTAVSRATDEEAAALSEIFKQL